MCVVTPIYISFHDDVANSTDAWTILNVTFDIIFAIDILIEFNTAIYDDIFKLVDERKSIAKNYIGGMFFLDLIAVIPFETVLSNWDDASGMNQMIRITKLNRLQKLIKLTRLLKLLKVLK